MNKSAPNWRIFLFFLCLSVMFHGMLLGFFPNLKSIRQQSGSIITEFSALQINLQEVKNQKHEPHANSPIKSSERSGHQSRPQQVSPSPSASRLSTSFKAPSLVREFLEKNKSYPSAARARQEEGKVVFELVQTKQAIEQGSPVFAYKILEKANSQRLNQSARELFEQLVQELNFGKLKEQLSEQERASLLKSWEVVYQLKSSRL